MKKISFLIIIILVLASGLMAQNMTKNFALTIDSNIFATPGLSANYLVVNSFQEIGGAGMHMAESFRYNRRSNNIWKGIGIYGGATFLTVGGYYLNANGKKPLGHIMNATGTGVYLAAPFVMDYNRYENNGRGTGWKMLLTYMASIAANAVGDALIDDGQELAGYSLNAAGRGLLVVSPWIKYDRSQWGWFAANYLMLRFGSFDLMYNGVRGLPLDYTGNSSLTDKAWNKFKPREKVGIQGFFFGVGTIITLQYKRNTAR